MKNFKAVMFDFDGTVTPRGVYEPSPETVDLILQAAKKVPVAFCTGRQLESFLRHGYNYLIDGLDEKEKREFLANLFLFGENGSMGYHYDLEKDSFEQFYEIEWPENFIAKDELRTTLGEAIKEYGDIYYNAHKVAVVLRTNLHSNPDRKVQDVYDLSDKLFETTCSVLSKMAADYEDYLHVGNSGIGVIVCPANGDKDSAIREFAEYLRVERSVSIGPEAREILVVGDRPEKSGNDHYFLMGNYGTPFSVGGLCEGKEFPKGVYDESGKRLLHDAGTGYLIRNLLLTSC